MGLRSLRTDIRTFLGAWTRKSTDRVLETDGSTRSNAIDPSLCSFDASKDSRMLSEGQRNNLHSRRRNQEDCWVKNASRASEISLVVPPSLAGRSQLPRWRSGTSSSGFLEIWARLPSHDGRDEKIFEVKKSECSILDPLFLSSPLPATSTFLSSPPFFLFPPHSSLSSPPPSSSLLLPLVLLFPLEARLWARLSATLRSDPCPMVRVCWHPILLPLPPSSLPPQADLALPRFSSSAGRQKTRSHGATLLTPSDPARSERELASQVSFDLVPFLLLQHLARG